MAVSARLYETFKDDYNSSGQWDTAQEWYDITMTRNQGITNESLAVIEEDDLDDDDIEDTAAQFVADFS